MAIIGFSASQGIPGGVDIHAGIQDPSGEQRQEAEEPIPHQSTSAAPTSSVLTTLITAPSTSAAATSLPVVNPGFTAPSTSAATYTTPSTASTATVSITTFNSCQCSQDLVELEREKVGLLKDVCGLLREAAE
ncbi:hypothetical protein N1851_016099 [Merluccius polli]|uniref:Uncharacterized protein n=1 Tax=Merluccius polli TaxID=89951 RepID=A0AA47MRM9_MERPO|nr:hypothetical protein N1851_016099 [Merluccius polli]